MADSGSPVNTLDRRDLVVWRVWWEQFTMSVAMSQRPAGKGSIRAALPWIGMGLCLAVVSELLAYDRLLGKPPNPGRNAPACASSRRRTTPASRGTASPAESTTVTLDETKYVTGEDQARRSASRPHRDGRFGGGADPGEHRTSRSRSALRAAGIIREVLPGWARKSSGATRW